MAQSKETGVTTTHEGARQDISTASACSLQKVTSKAAILAALSALLGALLLEALRGKSQKRKQWLQKLFGAVHQLRQFHFLPKTWPPAPKDLIRVGTPLAAVGAVVVVAAAFQEHRQRALVAEEDGDAKSWIATARKTNETVLSEMIERLPMAVLLREVPSLRSSLSSKHLESVDDVANSNNSNAAEGSTNEADKDAAAEMPMTAEELWDATEKLIKIDRSSSLAWEGVALTAALMAFELRKGCRELREAVKTAKLEPDKPEASTAGVSEAQTLNQLIKDTQEFAEEVWYRALTRKQSKQLCSLVEGALREAEEVVRKQHAEQWRCVAQLLWTFREAAPFVLMSSLLSGVLGAFSAMRLHYQAAVINVAKEAALASQSSSKSQQGKHSRSASIAEAVMAMVVSEVVSQLALFARERLKLYGKERLVVRLKVALLEALLRQDLAFLEQCDLGTHRGLILSTEGHVGNILDFPSLFVEALSRVVAALVSLGGKSWSLTIFLIVAMAGKHGLSELIDMLGKQMEYRMAPPTVVGQINDIWRCLRNPSSIRTMRAFAREPEEVGNFHRQLTTNKRVASQRVLIFRLQEPMRSFVENGLQIITMWYGGHLALRGEIDFGSLSSLVLVAERAFDGAYWVSNAARSVNSTALGPLALMATLLARKPKIGLDSPPIEEMPDPSTMEWSVKFENVSFSYPQRAAATILKNLSFEARGGQFLGVVGGTGAGKSTIFALLLRFYDPNEGRILLDGQDLRSYNPLWLRTNIGVVSQELMLVNRTVHANLKYGCHGGVEASDEEARKALRVAQCEQTFFNPATFPALWHTDVGLEGSKLSGGEKQRLAVARAILKKPHLLLLDEATSALDELSQAKLQESLEEMRKGRPMTVVCIAHRLSNLAKADRLVVLENGTVAEEGSPSELLSIHDGQFAEYARTHLAAVQAPVGATSNGESAERAAE